MIYQIKGEPRFVKKIAEYQNGIETTGGLYQENELIACDHYCTVTYDSAHATELPVGWPRMRFLDDNNIRQKIKSIRFDKEPAYIMEDNSESWEVTE